MDKSPFSVRTFFSIKNIIIILTVFMAVLLAVLIGYFIGFNQVQEELDQERAQTHRLMGQIKDLAKKKDGETLKVKKEPKEETLAHEPISARHEYESKDNKATPPPAEVRSERPIKACTAKLVIIMDDVSYAHDVSAIRSVGLPLVMSFLPPSARHPDSAQLAASVPGYMVHLPLEAVDFTAEEPITLRISDSLETITKQIALIKHLYPNVHYINNHTGSKFTSDEGAMDRLICIMKENGLVFVDSRTIASSKVKQVDAKYGLRYLGRDVFLDHKDGVANVKKKIREAIAIAKRHGSAIAIGHPRPDTLQALKESKDILREIQLVRIDQI